MLPAINRLRLRGDFKTIKRSGKNFPGEQFSLLVYPTKNNYSRFGLIISNKVCPLATQRNKIKRRLREAIRAMLPRIKPGLDVLFLAKRGLLKQDFTRICLELEKISRAAGLLEK